MTHVQGILEKLAAEVVHRRSERAPVIRHVTPEPRTLVLGGVNLGAHPKNTIALYRPTPLDATPRVNRKGTTSLGAALASGGAARGRASAFENRLERQLNAALPTPRAGAMARTGLPAKVTLISALEHRAATRIAAAEASDRAIAAQLSEALAEQALANKGKMKVLDWVGERAVKVLEAPLEKALGVGVAGAVALALSKFRKRSLLDKVTDGASTMFGPGSPGRKALAFGAGAATIGVGIEGGSTLYDAIEGPLKKRKFMNRMLEENPHLKRENPKDVAGAFNTLYTFNKRMASDPLVAGSFTRRALQFREEGVQPVDIKTLVEAHPKAPAESRFKGILPSTAKELMSFGGMEGS